MTTLKNVAGLIAEVAKLSTGEIRALISNPTDRPGGERVVISAFGQEYGVRNLAGAATLLELWKAQLVVAGFAMLSQELQPRVYRATLFRTSGGDWRVDTQTTAGVLATDSWSVSTPDSEVAAAVTAANNTMASRGYVSAFGWAVFPERSDMLVTLLLKA